MLIETVELTLAHVGLGELREVSLLALFATAQAHALVRGTTGTLHDVTDANGAKLYPGYTWLKLRVPTSRTLSRFRVWDHVGIGVEVKRFGGLVLDSTYALAAPGELTESAEAWDLDAMPSMRAMSMWVVDGNAGAPQPSSPRPGALAAIPSLKEAPDAMTRFRAMRAAGSMDRSPHRWATQAPLRYPLHVGRDGAHGHNLMFATYIEIMEIATERLLGEEIWPALPADLLACRTVLEREVFFLDHAAVGAEILVDVRANLSPCASDLHGAANDMVSGGILDVVFELYEAGTNKLLTVARARELFILPRSRASLVSDVARFLP
ncbi:MAG TPA: hypothetical protein VGM39_14525 [Kofleriaceae bacterium]